MLKHFGAAAASSGGVEMYHIPGITAEANSVEEAFGWKKPGSTMKYGAKEKRIAYDILNSAGVNTNVDFIMLGCPHYSLEQVAIVADLLRDKKINSGVTFWIFMPGALRYTAERNGFVQAIEAAGGVVMRDCCPIMDPFIPEGASVMATDSAKQAHYMPSLTGVESWFGSVQECVRAALSGKWDGECNG
jgi:predicted aconitase